MYVAANVYVITLYCNPGIRLEFESNDRSIADCDRLLAATSCFGVSQLDISHSMYHGSKVASFIGDFLIYLYVRDESVTLSLVYETPEKYKFAE
jgi:hypothetical protein